MPDIKHLIEINCPPEIVFRAVSEKKGIQGWWTSGTSIKPVINSFAEFTFGGRYYNKMIIRELITSKSVMWECLEGDNEWVGTTIHFDLEKTEKGTILRFSHNKWRKDSDFYATCNYHWGHYMTSIKNYCETGKGNPYRE